MSEHWQLKDFCQFQEGYVNPPQEFPEYFDGSIKWLRAMDLNDGYVNHTSRTLTEMGFRSAGASALLFPKGSIAISKSGTIGVLGILEDDMCGNRAIIDICVDEKKVPLLYVFYLLRYKRVEIKQQAVGSIQKNLYVSALETIKLCHTNYADQKNISSTLSTIDQKIRNNQRICETLESLAQDLYHYWFTQFDFPDERGRPYCSSGGKMVWNKELGREIPKGWGPGPLTALGEIVGGATPSTKNPAFYCENGIPWITPKDMSETNDKYILRGKTTIGTVLLTSRAPIGYLGIANNPLSTNQGFKSIIPKEEYGAEYLYYMLKDMVPSLKSMGAKSTFQEVSKSVLEITQVLVPDTKIANMFKDIVASLTDTRKTCEAETRELASLRDFLLPLLMNGQVWVGEDRERRSRTSPGDVQ